jgi:hypothetical protein
MTLFSEMDWIVLIAVGAFFLLGRDGGAILRQVGRWYGRAVNLKRELLAEVTRSAGLPGMPGGGPGSLRALLLSGEGAVRSPMPAPVAPSSAPAVPPGAMAQSSGTGGRP